MLSLKSWQKPLSKIKNLCTHIFVNVTSSLLVPANLIVHHFIHANVLQLYVFFFSSDFSLRLFQRCCGGVVQWFLATFCSFAFRVVFLDLLPTSLPCYCWKGVWFILFSEEHWTGLSEFELSLPVYFLRWLYHCPYLQML